MKIKRTLLSALAAILLLAGCGIKQTTPQNLSLKEAFGDKFLVGVALNTRQVAGKDSAATRLIKRHFNSIVAENCMKSVNIHPEEGRYNFGAADSIVEYGEKNGMAVIGHCLIWHSQCAPWFCVDKEGKNVSPDIMKQRMKEHITTVVNRYKGRIKGWDVVNEAISGGGNDGEGFYVLQSASNAGADAANNFYWQDYLGSEDYVRIVVAAARKYYAENGGVKPLKLFINDYNLESTWDNNQKAKSLVHWIEKWESDGVTKIDGIGTQMHVAYRANAADQQKQEEHVVKMFEILAKSGKLVKVSELDMGYVDESGTTVLTKDMTEEQHKAMAEYYKFIVKKYFEIIPVAQQYGITQWCATDAPGAPGDSNWRGGEPVGLWDSNYNRKHTYAGFADGLAGK